MSVQLWRISGFRAVTAGAHLVATFLASGLPASAQTVEIRILSGDTELPFSIEATRIVTLGSEQGHGTVGGSFRLQKGPEGRYYFAYSAEPEWVKVFDAGGEFLQRVGGAGAGPGEYDFIRLLEANDTSLWVFDTGNARLSVLGLPGLALLTTQPIRGAPVSTALMVDGAAVYSASVPTRRRAGLPLHEISAEDLSLSASFGDDGMGFRADLPHLLWRLLAASSRPGKVWAARFTAYAIELWEPGASAPELRIERPVEWFEAHTRGPQVSPSIPPPSYVLDIHEDSNGLLWALVAVPDEDWQEGVRLMSEPVPGHPLYDIDDHAKYWDSIVEVIDPSRGLLLASRRFDAYMELFTGDGEVGALRIDESGYPKIDVWHLSLIAGGN